MYKLHHDGFVLVYAKNDLGSLKEYKFQVCIKIAYFTLCILTVRNYIMQHAKLVLVDDIAIYYNRIFKD